LGGLLVELLGDRSQNNPRFALIRDEEVFSCRNSKE
jgi:hypothetical protein